MGRGHRASGQLRPRRGPAPYIRVEWQLVELNGTFYLAPPKEGSRRDVDIPGWLFELLRRLVAQARRCKCPRGPDDTASCGSREAFLFLGADAGHARRSNYSARTFRPASDGVRPAQTPRKGRRTLPWRVHCYSEPCPGIPVPVTGRTRSKVEELADCCWAPLAPGLTPHGLRHGHETAMRRDRVPRVLRRERLGHGRSADITDRYTHIDREMVDELLANQTARWRSALAARARADESRGAEPRSGVPALDQWLAPFRERRRGSSSHLRSHPQAPEVEA